MRRDQLTRRIQQTSLAAKAERRQSPQIIQRGKAVRAGGGGRRRAFVKTTPGATTSVDVYLDEDNSSKEATITCYIYGGGDLNGAYPPLVDGMPFWVAYENGTWRNVTSFYKIAGSCNES
ncbi:MAG: hypothetical protein J7M40_02935 [Planctomycetes bacterium]|nr:hypothetical protein [Planctomycetota bacterium]